MNILKRISENSYRADYVFLGEQEYEQLKKEMNEYFSIHAYNEPEERWAGGTYVCGVEVVEVKRPSFFLISTRDVFMADCRDKVFPIEQPPAVRPDRVQSTEPA